jgi:hypothetical protein
MRKNRRGNITDIGFLIITLFFIGIFSFIGVFVFGQIRDRLVVSPVFNETPEAIQSLNDVNNRTGMFDFFGLAIFIGFTISIMVTGWFIGGNPLFMIVYFLVLVALVVVGMVLSNVWETFTQAGSFGYLTSPLPITNHLITYLPIYMVVVAFLGMVAMFGKPYISGGEY